MNNTVQNTSLDPQLVWQEVCSQLKLRLSPAVYNTWIVSNPLTDIRENSESVFIGTITSPTAFHSINVKKNFQADIRRSLEKITGKKFELEFEIGSTRSQGIGSQGLVIRRQKTARHGGDAVEGRRQSSNEQNELFSEQTLSLSAKEQQRFRSQKAGLRQDFVFESFAVSSTNEMAHAAATAVSQRPGQAYNPLFLYGGVGVGKTHLMHAIGNNILKEKSESKIIYCTGEVFTNEIVGAIRSKQALRFKNKYRSAQVLLIDDIQFIAGKNAVQEEFFHTFNALTQQNSQVVLTSDRPPHEISLLEDRLRSRFEAGLMIDIGEPSFELRTAILLIKAKQHELEIPMQLAQHIAAQIESARKLEGIVKKIHSAVLLKRVEVSEELINQILDSEQRLRPRKIKMKPHDLIKTVANHYHIKQIALKGKSRVKSIVTARHIAMYLMKTKLDLSFSEIGRLFSNRDHTTAMHAIKKIEKLLSRDNSLQQDVHAISTTLSAAAR